MASTNLKILSIPNYSPTERAIALSSELLGISRPPAVRSQSDISRYLFGWTTHPITGECVLHVDLDHVIKVHPENNLSNLIALMPKMHEDPEQHQVIVDQLSYLISNSQSITFGELLTGQEITLTNEELEQGGWFG